MRKDVLLWAGRMGAAFLVALLVTGWMDRSALGLSVVETTLYFSVLFFSYRYGPGTGAVAGTACGVICTLQAEGLAPLAMLCLGGTFGGAFRSLGRIGSALGFVTGAAGAGILYGLEELQSAGLALLFGTVLFFLLPKGLLLQQWDKPLSEEQEEEGEGYEGLAARRLRLTAEAFEGLASSFPSPLEESSLLSPREGEEIFRRCAELACKNCSRCMLSRFGGEELPVYLPYLLRLFEKQGALGREDLPGPVEEHCLGRDRFFALLNEELGRARQRSSWKARFYESREAVFAQFGELGRLLSELAGELEETRDVTAQWEGLFRRLLEEGHLRLSRLLVLERGNGCQEAYLTVSAPGKYRVTAREAAALLEKGTGRSWQPALEEKLLVGREPCLLQLREEPDYRVLFGSAVARKEGEEVSGDSFSCIPLSRGKALLCLSDGCGSGKRAREESESAAELAEQLMEAGLSPLAAAKVINAALLLRNEEQQPTTLDLAVADLYGGTCQFVKLGAAASFLLKEGQVVCISGQQPPLGIFRALEEQSLTCELEDGCLLVMVTDGVLEAFPGGDKEQAAADFLAEIQETNPRKLAELFLEKAGELSGKVRDDMTVLVAGFWKK